MKIETKTLKNGVKIVVDRIPYMRSVAFGIFVRSGSRNESENENGASHFIEHLMFKGTKTRSARDIADELDAVGGQLNAYTTKEYTCYYTKTLDIHFDLALNVLSDMFFNSVFDEAEIKKESNVICEEISMYEDSPEDLVHDLIQNGVWEGNPLSRPILGTVETVTAFDRASITRFFEDNYTPLNTVIAIAGNVSDEMVSALVDVFGKRDEKGTARVYEKPGFTPVYKEAEKDIEQLHMLLAFESFGIGTDDTYAMAVFNTFFGGGMSSRLFQNIREDKGLVYSIYSYNSSYNDAGVYGIYAALGPENAPDALRYIYEEIEALKKGVDDETIRKAREQILSNHLMGLESSSSRMSSAGRGILLLNRVLTTDELTARIENVSATQIKGVIDRVLLGKKPGLCSVGKLSGALQRAYENCWR